MDTEFTLDSLDTLEFKFKDYFGPDRNYKFEEYMNQPFHPYNRFEQYKKQDKKDEQAQKNYKQQQIQQLNLVQEDFKEVGKNPVFQKPKQRKPQQHQQKSYQRTYNGAKQNITTNTKTQQKQTKKAKLISGARPTYKKNIKMKDPIQQKANWNQVYEITKPIIEKSTIQSVENEIIKTTGSLRQFDTKIDRANYKKELKFATEKLYMHNSNTQDDDNIYEFLQKNLDEKVENTCLYTTDTFLLALMTVKNSQFPWYIYFTKDGNHIWFDKYEKEKDNQSYLDLHTVNENINFEDDENQVLKWQLESTHVMKTLQEKCQTGEVWEIGEEENTVQGCSQESNQAFRYTKTTLDDKYEIYTRVAIDAYIEKKERNEDGEDEITREPVLVKTINEYDLSSDWRKKLETRPGEVFSKQQLDNICSYTKWLCQLEISDTPNIKVISTSRASSKDDKSHAILNVDSLTAEQFKNQIKFDTKECWKVVKHFLDKMQEMEDGEYIMIKNAFKQNINIKRIPNQDEEEDEDEDENEEEGQNEEQKEDDDGEDEDN